MRSVVRGVELGYGLTNGDEPAFVWGHGLTSSRAREDEGLMLDWERLSSAVATLRYDARGHGESELTDDTADYGWDQLALDQLELTTQLGINRYVAGGASMGAATALHAAVTAPDRITGLLLVIPPTAWETRAEQVDQYAKMARILDRYGVDPLLSAAATDMAIPDPFAGRGLWEQSRSDALRAADPARLAMVFRGAGTADFPSREQVASIGVPTRILAWSGDPGHPVSSAEELAGLIPDAELRIASTWDEQRAWTDDALNFLATLR